MTVKGTIPPDAYMTNFYIVQVEGKTLTALNFSATTEELRTVVLSDNTVISEGNRSALTFNISINTHIADDHAFMREWFSQSVQPTALNYKKDVTVTVKTNSGTLEKTYIYRGAFPTSNEAAGLAMSQGQDHQTVWTFSADSKEEI